MELAGADVYHGDVARVAGRPGSMQQAAASRLFSLYWGFVDIMLWKVRKACNQL